MTDAHTRRTFAGAEDVAAELRPTSPLYCLRPDTIRAVAARFVAAFPGETAYAVKCNPHPSVVQAVREGGVRAFDTASLAEIAQIREGWPEAEPLSMNPVRAPGAAATARERHGVRVFVVDHPDELAKLAAEIRDPGAVTVAVRIAPPGGGARMDLTAKFGADPRHAADLLRAVAAHGMWPGVAFHVGSQCIDPAAYKRALALVDEVVAEAGVRPALLDVGGGFPAPYAGESLPPLTAFTRAIDTGLRAMRLPPGCRVVAEPGRTLTATGQSLLVHVNLRAGRRLYINDGVFGGLNEVDAAGIRPPARIVRPDGPTPGGATAPFDLAGPTCDSEDMIADAVALPDDVAAGDWLEIDGMGAYSNAAASAFNGFAPAGFVEVADPPPCCPTPDTATE